MLVTRWFKSRPRAKKGGAGRALCGCSMFDSPDWPGLALELLVRAHPLRPRMPRDFLLSSFRTRVRLPVPFGNLHRASFACIIAWVSRAVDMTFRSRAGRECITDARRIRYIGCTLGLTIGVWTPCAQGLPRSARRPFFLGL